jgi:multicomponent K+:H+ antiporter subunit D
VTGGALFYLAGSVLALGAFFLLIELVERGRGVGADVLAVTREAFGEGEEEEPGAEEEVGAAIPATMAILGMSFIGCALLLAGLPPLSGFLAKFAMLAPLIGAAAPAAGGGGGGVPAGSWALAAALILSGLATVVAMLRAGINTFWAPTDGAVPRVRVIEAAPVALLLLLCLGLTAGAGRAMDYMQATARSLHAPQDYVRGVLSAPRTGEGGGG